VEIPNLQVQALNVSSNGVRLTASTVNDPAGEQPAKHVTLTIDYPDAASARADGLDVGKMWSLDLHPE